MWDSQSQNDNAHSNHLTSPQKTNTHQQPPFPPHTYISKTTTHTRIIHIHSRHRPNSREREQNHHKECPDDTQGVGEPTEEAGSHVERSGFEDDLGVVAVVAAAGRCEMMIFELKKRGREEGSTHRNIGII